jgi:enamine deaminase RidA (YjgF/YER057c/UK114 family)
MFDLVVQATIHLADMADLPAVNDVYNKYFEEPYPTYKVIWD